MRAAIGAHVLYNVTRTKAGTRKAAEDGAVVLLRDVARVELGGSDYLYLSRMNGKPAR